MGQKNRKGLVIVVSAPSGSGKTTIVDRILSSMDNITRSVSFTTRNPRQGEVNKKDYFFITEEAFKEKIESRDFLEWEKNFDNYYGTCKLQIQEAVDSGVDVVLSIDVRGARNIKKVFPACLTIFIAPPSIEELERRLRDRQTESEDAIALRLSEAKREMEAKDEFEYLIVNDDLGHAVEEIRHLIEIERYRKK